MGKSSWCNKVYCNEKTVRSSKLSTQIGTTGDKDYFVDTTAQAGVKYSYKIKPVNALGYGGYGNAVSVSP